jgi:outer membrane protein, heavy metal efflux system
MAQLTKGIPELAMRGRPALTALVAATLLVACATTPRPGPARLEDLARGPLPLPPPVGSLEADAAREVRELLAEPLTPDSAVRIAMLQNRELRAVLLEIDAARGRAAQAGTLPDPAFRFSLRRPVDGDGALQKDFALEYALTRALLAPRQSAPGQAEVEAERLRAASAALELGVRVRIAFHSWQAAWLRLAATNRMLDALAAGRDAARALFEAGNLRELDLVVHEAAYESARATAAEVELDLLERREALHRLLGLHGGASAWTARTELPAPEEPELVADAEAEAVRSSLQLAEMRQRLEALARRTGLARLRGRIPEVRIAALAEQDDGRWEVGGGATFTIPLFERQRGALAAYEAEFDALLERYEGAAVAIRSAAREARHRLESTYRRARHHLEVVVLARRRVVDHALRQVNAMELDVFELLRFRRELLEADLAAADALRDYWIARAGWDALVSGALPTGSPEPAARGGLLSSPGGGGPR